MYLGCLVWNSGICEVLGSYRIFLDQKDCAGRTGQYSVQPLWTSKPNTLRLSDGSKFLYGQRHVKSLWLKSLSMPALATALL